MDDIIFRGYYRPSGFDWYIWKFTMVEDEVRSFLRIDRNCGFITFLIMTFTFVILTYSFLSTKVTKSNKTLCRALQSEASELQQTDVFQEKARRTAGEDMDGEGVVVEE
ncbi:hypothetical protein PV325_010249 [Microctonus aethiopoides]|nr:hypothetical protein PV325_010249 [Microctonus aethiopoides]